MTIYKRGDIVCAPFPHVERLVYVSRPALVASIDALGPARLLTWVLMITNAKRPDWEGDVLIPNAPELGLVIPSKVRVAKIYAVETASLALIGQLDAAVMRKVDRELRGIILPTAP